MIHGGIALALGGYLYESAAVKLGGKGDVSKTHRLWQVEKKINAISSPLIVDNVFYRTRENFISCHSLETGEQLWKERFSLKGTWATPTLVGDKIYLVDKSGITTVFKHNPAKLEVLHQNETNGAETNGSLYFADDAIYMRSHKTLWKFATK